MSSPSTAKPISPPPWRPPSQAGRRDRLAGRGLDHRLGRTVFKRRSRNREAMHDAVPAMRFPLCAALIPTTRPLKDLVWFRAGGAAEILFRPADADDLASFLAARPLDIPLGVIGVGSNLLVRDGGIPGVVVRLPASFGKIERGRHANSRRCGGARCRRRARRRRRRHRRPGISARHSRHNRRRPEDECRLLWPRDQGHFRRSDRHRRQGQQARSQTRRHGLRLSQIPSAGRSHFRRGAVRRHEGRSRRHPGAHGRADGAARSQPSR